LGKNGNGTVTAAGQIETVFFNSHCRILENRELQIEKIDHMEYSKHLGIENNYSLNLKQQ
jgi:hypothetical protein